MMKKKRLWLSLALALVLALCGCSDSSGSTDEYEEISGNEQFSGYWVLTPEAENSEGLPLVRTMQIDPEEGVFYSYDQFGIPSDSMPCMIDGNTIILDLMLTQAEYTLDGEYLINENGEADFVRTDDPGFLEVPAGYDGKWTKVDNEGYEEYYIFNGSEYTHSMSYDGESWNESEPAEWTPGNMQCILATGESIKNVPTITLNFPDPTFYVDPTGQIAYVQDMFAYDVYVHESMTDPEMINKAVSRSQLMSTQFRTMPDENGQFLYLRFLPYGFDILTFDETGSRIDTPYGEGCWSGTWDLDDAGDLFMTDSHGEVYYGSTDYTAVKLDIIDATFYME